MDETNKKLMRRIRYCITLPVLLLLLASVIKADTPDEPYKLFREFAGLNEEQIGAIRSGKAVAKVTESRTPARCSLSARSM